MPQLTLNNHLLYNMLSYTSPSVAPCKGTPIPSVCIVFPEVFYLRTRPGAFAWPSVFGGACRQANKNRVVAFYSASKIRGAHARHSSLPAKGNTSTPLGTALRSREDG